MGYLAIARKWRPSQFDDLVGQEHVVQTLKNAIQLGRVSHAYLFSGARGVGKTSVARIFAKVLRCPNAKNGVACNQCPECQAISESRSVDVVEIDGASNNGVEAVRGIRENVAYGASSGHYKIYIIDEVHMLSLSAFNALLKTLEEPPAHVIFVFATTESQKIPMTILSRCQRFEFRRLTNGQIVKRLQFILSNENVTISEEGLRLLSAAADGSLRDALSLLDQVLSYLGDNARKEVVNEKLVVNALGVSEVSHVSSFLERILKKDVKGLVELIGEIHFAGIDLKHFSERCLEELRLLYLMVLSRETGDVPTAESLDVSAGHFAKLSDVANRASLVQVERMAQILAKSISQIGWSSLPRFVLEMAAVRMTKLDLLAQLEGPAPEIEMAEEIPAPPPPAAIAAPVAPPQSQQQMQRPSPPQQPPPNLQPPPPQSAPHSAGGGNWKSFVDGVMKKRPLLGALLCHADFKKDGNVVTLGFPEGSFYHRQVVETKNRAEIDEMLKSYFGRETSLALGAATPETSNSIETTKNAEAAVLKKQALEHPTVVKMKEILGAEVVDVNVEGH